MNNCPVCGNSINSMTHRCARFPICTFVDEERLGEKITDYILFDIETTGLDRKKDRITEIGALRIHDGKIVDEFSTLVNPGKDDFGERIYISPRITSLTGITNEMVEDCPVETEAVSQFAKWCEGTDCFAGQNIVRFDLPFVKEAAKRAGCAFQARKVLDTLRIATSLDLKGKGLVNSYKQTSLAACYGFTYNAHRAVDDAKACFRILNFLIEDGARCGKKIVPEKLGR